MASVKSIANKTGMSWGAVLSFAMLFAFILYAAGRGSLVKYKAYLWSTSTTSANTSGNSQSSSSSPSTPSSVSQASQSVAAQRAAQNQQNTQTAINQGIQIAGLIAAA